ncbi:MAG: 4-(cytidine 5'-diphospho)-2-C-methyl-D-erythritol kinase [Clostridia bacterium]|nr:4-(cytidine 5'-diphospho)-2-C-methyl-D-erythritol kinase [Clostridia bacterium]
MKLKIQARAKINWTLDVVGTLPNGYHDLDMLMQSVTLCDQMTMEDAPVRTLAVRSSSGMFVPADENNLVLRAAAALAERTGCERGARITLRKYIPVAAGMGGGSSDAAAALQGLNVLWGLGLGEDELEKIGLDIGADVPFCVRGGLQRARGIGERLTPVPLRKPLYLVAFQPCRGLSTKEVFTSLHEEGIRPEDRPDNEAAQRALTRGDVRGLGRSLGNVLEPVSRRLRPEIDRAIRAIEEAGAVGARMTGSGSAVFGVFMHAGACRKAAQQLQGTYPACRMMRTAERGVVIERVGE